MGEPKNVAAGWPAAIAAALALGALAGCEVAGESATHHFGYVRVERPAAATVGAVERRHILTVGLRAENGVAIGYFDESWIKAPRDCRLVVIVPSDESVARVVERLQYVAEEGLCVVKQ